MRRRHTAEDIGAELRKIQGQSKSKGEFRPKTS